jgi:peptidoglycan/xylan/chitin deacetylase (PgdA/CDA1 family)
MPPLEKTLNPVILTYHSIAAGSSPLHTPPSVFARQMEWLRSRAQVVALEQVVSALRGRRPLPARSVVLTFDDGFADFHENAAPILLRLGFPAIVFLPVDYCGGTNRWPGQPAWVREQPLMSWAQVRELAERGIQFGSHSRSHPKLTELGPEKLEAELVESAQEIRSRAGCEARFFCYPYGQWNAAVRQAVQRHYEGACSTGVGQVERDADPFALPRVDACYLRSAALFQSLFTRRFAAYLAARRLVRRLRHQPEGHYARLPMVAVGSAVRG